MSANTSICAIPGDEQKAQVEQSKNGQTAHSQPRVAKMAVYTSILESCHTSHFVPVQHSHPDALWCVAAMLSRPKYKLADWFFHL